MARTVIDSIGVEVTLDDDPLLEGLRVADRAVTTFTDKTRAPLSVRVVPDLTPLEQALARLPTLDPLRVPVTLDTAALDQSLRTLQSRLQGVAEVRATTSLDPGPLETALADMERLVGTFRTRAESELELVPTIDTRGTRVGLEQLVEVATAASARLQDLRTSLPAPDTSATQAALEAVLASLTRVREGVASLNVARIRVDAGDLLAQLTRAQTEIERLAQSGGVTIPVTLATQGLTQGLAAVASELQGLGGVTVPVTLDTTRLAGTLADVRAQLEALGGVRLPVALDVEGLTQSVARVEAALGTLGGVTVPVTVDAAGFRAALADLSGRLGALEPVALPVGLDLSGLTTAVRDVEATLSALPPVTVPVRLDTAGVSQALSTLAAQLEGLGGVAVPVKLDTAGFRAAVTDIQQQLAGLGGVVLPATLDTSKLAASIQAIRGQLDLGTLTIPVTLDAAPALQALAQLQARLTELAAPITLQVRVEGTEQARAAAQGVSEAINPTAFQAFADATTQSLRQVAQSLEGLNGTIAQISAGVGGLFQGAAEALEQFSRSSSLAATAQSDLAQRSLQAAESYRAAGVAEDELNATLERSGLLSVEAAQALDQQAAATLRLAEASRQAAAQRQAALAAGAGTGAAAAAVAVPTGFDKLAADQQRVAAGSRDLAAGFALASRQAAILREAEAALSTGNGRMAAGFAVAAEQARELAEAEGRVAVASTKAGAATAAHGLGARQTALHFVTFAAASTGLDTAIARTAANLAIAGSGFAGIGTIITGISLAVIAAAEAWHFFGQSNEDAKKKAEDLKTTLDRLRESQKGPVIQAQETFDAQVPVVRALAAQLGEVDRQLLQVQASATRTKTAIEAIAEAGAGEGAVTEVNQQATLLAQRATLVKQLAEATDGLHTAFTALTTAENEEHGAELLRSLNQEVQSFGLGEVAARKLAVALDEKLTDAQKQSATAALNTLGALKAQRTAMEESLTTTQRLAEAELKRLSQQATTPIGQTFSLEIDTGGTGLRALQSEIQDSVNLLDTMRKKLDQTSDAAKVLARAADGFRALGDRVKEAIPVADAAPIKLLGQAVTDLASRLSLLRAGFGETGTVQTAAAQTAQRLGQAYAQLLVEIERQGGPLQASTEALRAAATAAEDLSRADVRGAALGVLSENLAEAQGRLQEFSDLATRLGQDFPEIRVKLNLEIEQAKQALADFFAKLAQRQDEEVKVKLKVDIEGGFEKAAAGAKDLGNTLPRQFDLAREKALTLNRGIMDIAESLSSINGAASQAAQSVLGLLSLFQQLGAANKALQDAQNATEVSAAQLAKTGATIGLIAGGVGVAAGLLGSLFGGGESEGDRIRRENNQRLTELNATITRQIQGAGGLQGLGTTAGNLSHLADTTGATQALGFSSGADELKKELAKAGFTIEQFAAQIKAATGIDILDSKGRIVGEAFDQAKQAIDAMNEAARHFAEDIATQNRIRETDDRLGIGPRAGLPPEQQRLERARTSELEGLNLDPATEKRIAALDLSTEEGRRAFLEFQRSLEILAKAGGLTADQLDKFKDVGELQTAINESADALDAFKKVTEQASLAQLQSRNALLARLFGDGKQPDASATFQSQVQAASALAPDISKQFAGLGTIGPEDQAAIRALLQKGFTDLIKGVIPKGLTAEEFQQFLEQGADFLDSFNQEVKDATKRLSDLNIPTGFRRAALAFQTGDRGPDTGLQPTRPVRTDEGGQVGPPLPIQPLESKPVPVTLDIRQVPLAGDGASLPALADVLGEQKDVLEELLTFLAGGDAGGPTTKPTTSSSPVAITIAPGAIVIHTQPGQDARDTAAAVLTEFRRLAMAQTGDTLNTGSFS